MTRRRQPVRWIAPALASAAIVASLIVAALALVAPAAAQAPATYETSPVAKPVPDPNAKPAAAPPGEAMPAPQASPAPAPATQPKKKDGKDEKKGDDDLDSACKRLPGGNAPVNKLLKIKGKMSVRNLEFRYFGKSLGELLHEDFDYLKKLLPYCSNLPQAVADNMVERLRSLIMEAQHAHADGAEWIQKSIAKMEALKPGPESIREVHNIWAEMQNQALTMTASDLKYISDYLDKKRQELYTSKERIVKPYAMFDPGPPIPRDAPD